MRQKGWSLCLAGNEKYTLYVKDIATGRQLLAKPIEVGHVWHCSCGKWRFMVKFAQKYSVVELWKYVLLPCDRNVNIPSQCSFDTADTATIHISFKTGTMIPEQPPACRILLEAWPGLQTMQQSSTSQRTQYSGLTRCLTTSFQYSALSPSIQSYMVKMGAIHTKNRLIYVRNSDILQSKRRNWLRTCIWYQ